MLHRETLSRGGGGEYLSFQRKDIRKLLHVFHTSKYLSQSRLYNTNIRSRDKWPTLSQFKASLAYQVRPCLKKTKNPTNKKGILGNGVAAQQLRALTT